MRVRGGRRTTIEWIRAAGEALRLGIDPVLWVLAGLIVAGTTLLRLGVAQSARDLSESMVAAADIVLFLTPAMLGFVLYRAASRAVPPLRINLALLRFLLLYLLTYFLLRLVLGTAAAAARTDMVLADVWLWIFLATTAAQLVLLPLAPWTAALAVGDRSLGPSGSWLGLRKQFLGFVGAYLTSVSPFFAVHLALTLLLDDPAMHLAKPTLIALVTLDSAASLAQLLLTVGLAVAAWTVARERAGKLEVPASDSRR